MIQIEPGTYVVHAKLPELGRGQILGSENGFVRIRFASGERNFQVEFVSPYLSLTADALPALLPTFARVASATKVRADAV